MYAYILQNQEILRQPIIVKKKLRQKKKACGKRKTIATKENNSREKGKDYGKRKIDAAKENNSQKNVKKNKTGQKVTRKASLETNFKERQTKHFANLSRLLRLLCSATETIFK